MKIRFLILILTFFFFSMDVFAINYEEVVTTKTSKLTIAGRLHTQYIYVNSEPYSSRLLLRRARLTFQSVLNKWVSMKLQFEAGKQKFTLKDAYIGFNPGWFNIYIGHKHVPFSREALNSSKNLQMIERSCSSSFAPFRQMGVGIHGFVMDKKLEYMAGFYNGAVNPDAVSDLGNNRLGKAKIYHIDIGASNYNNKFLYAGRIDFHPFGYMKKQQSYLEDLEHPLLSFGINFISSDESPRKGHSLGIAELKKTSASGGDFAFKYKGFAGTFEYLHRSLSRWNSDDQVIVAPQDTFTVQGGFMIIPKKFEVAVRYGFMKYDKNKMLLGPDGQNHDKWLTFGLNYFFEGQYTKIQINYILKHEDMPSGISQPKNNSLLIQFAIYF